jgi:hypothetical protein
MGKWVGQTRPALGLGVSAKALRLFREPSVRREYPKLLEGPCQGRQETVLFFPEI